MSTESTKQTDVTDTTTGGEGDQVHYEGEGEGEGGYAQEGDDTTQQGTETTTTTDDAEDPELANFREQLEEWDKAAPGGDDEANATEAGAAGANAASSAASDADLRSIFVSNVDYAVTEADLREYFSFCGEINRVTIVKDKHTGHSKGYAYIEFKETESLVNAMLVNETELRGRPIKVVVKRTNVPRHQLPRGSAAAGRGGFRGSFRGGAGAHPGMLMRGGMMYVPMPYGMPMPMYGAPGYFPRGRGGFRGGFRGGRGAHRGGRGGAAAAGAPGATTSSTGASATSGSTSTTGTNQQ